MPLPDFNAQGDLPEGLHRATFDEVVARFGRGSLARQQVTGTLRRIHELVTATGKVEQFVIFGSYVTSKEEPNDVDLVLVMKNDFSFDACDSETRVLFDHQRAQSRVGASIFWLVPSVVLRGSLEDFILDWGIKRDLSRRGIVEVIP